MFKQSNVNQGVNRWEIEPKLTEVPGPGAIALSRIPSISDVVTAFVALTSGIGCYAFSDNVLREPKAIQSRTGGLSDDAANYLEIIKGLVTSLEDLKVRKLIVSVLQRVNPSISSIELNDIQSPQNVLVGHTFGDKVLPLSLSQESDGFRRFYAHLLALYQRPAKQTMTFEHPEDGIHPGALSLLAEEFKAAAQTGRGQVILTTHSPQLLDQFDVDEIRVVELKDLQTYIGPIAAEQRESIQEGLLQPGELLTVDHAKSEMEGPSA